LVFEQVKVARIILVKFTPTFRYLMYVAESQVDPKQKFLYRGSFGETVDGAIRPIVILYEVSSLTFHKINHVPKHYSLGNGPFK
jgi:hypothetical protein